MRQAMRNEETPFYDYAKYPKKDLGFHQEVHQLLAHFAGKTLTYQRIDNYRILRKLPPYTTKERLVLLSCLQKRKEVTISYMRVSSLGVTTLFQIAKKPKQVSVN